MLNATSSWSKWSPVSVAFLALAAFAIPALGQEAADTPAPGGGYIDDWTHHHVVFSNPGTREDAVKHGTLDKWQKIANDPRYQLQQSKRSAGARPVVADPDLATENGRWGGGPPERPIAPFRLHRIPVPENPIEKDWSQSLGGSTTSLTSTLTATETSSTVSASSTITVGTQTFTGSAPTTAASYGTFSGTPTSGGTITITNNNPANTLVLHAIPGNGEGTDTFGGQPGDDNTITVGGTTYHWVSSGGLFSDCFFQGNPPCIYYGAGTAAEAAQNLAAALTHGAVACADTSGGACYWNISAANVDVTVSYTTGQTFVTLTNTQAATIAFSTNDTGEETLDPPTGTGIPVNSSSASNNCFSATLGYFSIGTSAGTAATNLGTAITNCNTTHSSTGVNLVSTSTGRVNIQADIAGTTANAIGLMTSGTGTFAWASTTLGGTGATTVATNGSDSATTFAYWSGSTYDTGSQLATDLHTALAANSTVTTTDGISGTAGTNQITFATSKAGPFPISVQNFPGFTGVGSISDTAIPGTVQPNAYPAKYGASLTTADCVNDFVVYPTGEAGSATAPTIVAFNNIYSSCTGTVPSVAWAYNTENGMTGYSATTSPTLSLDGSKVAFIQSNGTNAYLVVVKWASGGTLAAPTTLTSYSDITTCPAPCMTVTELSHNDTYSAPYYDYDTTSDNLWVGDNNGYLEQFTGVFKGAVAISTGLWPAHLGSAAVSSPVLDTISGYILVGDMGGTLYSVGSGTAGTTAASVHGTTGVIADAFADGPLVDSNTGRVFAFANQSKTSTYNGDNVVFGLTTVFTNATNIGTSPITVTVNNGAAGHYLYSGDFDNVYYQSSNGTGNIYAVGDTGLATGASLYRIGLSGGNLIGGSGVTQAVTGLSDGYAWPSPLTEFCNGACTVSGGVTNSGTDYVFFSVNQGAKGTCTGTAGNGCVMSYNVSNPSTAAFSGAQNYTNVGTNGCWATSGIVIDNDASTAGASQIYLIGLNGAEAGNPSGATSSACSAGAASGTTIQGIQASQPAP
jgi:hypothetical protein